ncbi:4-amino-4-deoxy-L-arabinose transferase-like glycosyltransferase [Pseudoxanthomonas sacheonensis]|uniref:4-amino-4-deoxy-L-arabinose transferase-like glycosyltransferase n=2 Tax=Pseudoxanthomonas sacheonensis TaxID=443615 RepID=A0ABU1RRD9_9GAMM|nr:4-amino-4-deoxy-L-arabinose transferase-like glycosyltransferase [Pseudoxanthomonas sacheonensis]
MSLSSSRLALLIVLIAVSLLAGLGMRDPSPPDEPRFVLAARDMVESGQWLFPHRGSEFYAEKPPVFMWMQAAAYEAIGNWRVAFLLPSLLAALLTLWLTYDLAARLWNRRAGQYAALALFVCLQFGLQAKRGQIDMVLVAMTTLSLYGLLRHLLRGPHWPLAWLGFFAAGLGTVTKGVGFLPVLVLLPWAVLLWRDRKAPRTTLPTRDGWRWLVGALCFVAGTGVWVVPMLWAVYNSSDPAFHAYAAEILLKQTGKRYAGAWHHVQPFWYFAQVIVTLWLPGALLLPWLVPAWWRRLRRGDRRFWLLLGWSALVLLFFSASPGKREVYIFPMLPALCVAAAPLLQALMRRVAVQRTLLGYVGVLALVMSALALSGLLGANEWAHRLAAQRDIDTATLRTFLFWLLAFGLTSMAVILWAGRRRVGTAVVVVTALLWMTYGFGLAPTLDADSSARKLMQRVSQRIGPQAQLGMVAWREQNALQSDRPTVDFGFKHSWQDQWAAAGPWLLEDPSRRWVFVLDKALSPCVNRARAIDIGQSNRNRWLLVPGNAWKPGCTTPAFKAEDDETP